MSRSQRIYLTLLSHQIEGGRRLIVSPLLDHFQVWPSEVATSCHL